MPLPSRPHFSFPFTLTAKGSKTVEQGSTEDIMAQAQVVAYCPLGYRQDRPEFGWPWPDLSLMPIDTSPLEDALNRFLNPQAQAEVQIDPAALANAALGIQNIYVNINIPTGGDAVGASQEVD